jgi:radical SAM superfamily enzyme YgiQ (UPF0313 family)
MRVLLVQSWLGGSEPLVFPLGLSCLKAALPGHAVKVFDTNLFTRPFPELAGVIAEFGPDVVGISLRNIDSTNKRKVVFYYPSLRETIDVIKLHTAAKIVVGGSGFSMFAQEIMADEPRIDCGVFLEGEAVFPELLENLDAPGRVRSVYYRQGGAVIFSGAREQADLNAAPLPGREGMASYDFRRNPDAIGVETKRGCVLDCIYCIYGFLNGKALRLRAPGRVVDEVESLVRDHGVERFTFVDSVFSIPRHHAEAVCREIVRRGLRVRWSAWFNERALTRDFIELARDAGCRNVILSPDAFSDESLRRLGKNIRIADILACHDLLKGIGGFEVSYNFFKNPPGQTLRAALALLSFAVRTKREMGPRVHFEFSAMRIEPHTKLHEVALAEGLVQPGENLLFPRYYTNPGTGYIEKLFNLLLALKGA